ncbi:hypothetical protein WISP_102342 [Willisornis vidua]|uniref:Uncharacterized protein n=1 Tax=Willisornis vidua TaxID=1566151 RepID=A0ABQ9D0Y1_9PASS|nr:hypothetical protein WISP_102342 [Willisornis vidua]
MSRQLSPERPADVGLNSQCWLISSLLVEIQKAFHQESLPAAIHITVSATDPHLNCSDATGLPICLQTVDLYAINMGINLYALMTVESKLVAQNFLIVDKETEAFTCSDSDGKNHLLGPVLFNIFINDLDAGLEGIPNKFTDNIRLGGATDSIKGRVALQKDLNKLEDWAIKHMKFNKGKSWILHLGWGNPECLYRLGNEMLESSAMERDLEVLIHGKLNMSQQCPGNQEGQLCPGGHQEKHHHPVKGGDCPTLLCIGVASP